MPQSASATTVYGEMDLLLGTCICVFVFVFFVFDDNDDANSKWLDYTPGLRWVALALDYTR